MKKIIISLILIIVYFISTESCSKSCTVCILIENGDTVSYIEQCGNRSSDFDVNKLRASGYKCY